MKNEWHRWEQNHEVGNPLSDFAPLLKKSWESCNDHHVPYDISMLPVIDESRFERLKQNSLRLYSYANRFVSLIMEHVGHREICFALFNQDGYLLKLYGEPAVLDDLSKSGITRLTDWSMFSLGANAVAVGLEHNIPFVTCGSENYARTLVDKAIYFSPCSLEGNDSGVSYVLGGIAIIVPLELDNPDYKMVCAAAAYDMNLHFFMSDALENAYSSDERGIVSVDYNIRTGKEYIFYHDANLFHVLNVPYSDIYFKPLTALVDKLPKNKQFWEVIHQQQRVQNMPMDLSVQGRTESYRITTEPYSQSKLALRGIRIFFTSMRSLSSKISKSVGNNALISFSDLTGKSPVFRTALRQAKTFAENQGNILIYGESGTGKDVFAQAIHNAGSRKKNPFIVVNCASFPREQLAGELFGYEGDHHNIGCFELAHTGTVFLNEISALPLDLQSSLLQVIEHKAFMRIGGTSLVSTDVRIIASTNTNILQLIEDKKFRADLYYRLNTFHLSLPTLAERKQDITLLADSFVQALCRRVNRQEVVLAPETATLLQRLPWRGNIRELQNVMEGVVLLANTAVIEPSHILEYLNKPELDDDHRSIHAVKQYKVTESELREALKKAHYNKQAAANSLGISRRTLYRYMDKYHMNRFSEE